LSSFSQDVLKFYQQLTGEERRIPFIFDDFHFCRSRVIGLDMTENRIFILCRMITWVVFLRMFWNFISSLRVKRVWSLSFLVGTISNVLVMEIGWTDVGSGRYILVSCAHSNTIFFVFFDKLRQKALLYKSSRKHTICMCWKFWENYILTASKKLFIVMITNCVVAKKPRNTSIIPYYFYIRYYLTDSYLKFHLLLFSKYIIWKIAN
jgi:hypothetical protein